MNDLTNGELFTQIALDIFKVSGILNAEGDELSEEFGLSSARWKVMGAIEKSTMPLTVPEIGRAMGQSRQATQRLVDVMIKDGLLCWADNPNHKRAKFVNLTEEGHRIYNRLDDKQESWAEKAAQGLTTEELKQVLSTLRKVALHFDRR